MNVLAKETEARECQPVAAALKRESMIAGTYTDAQWRAIEKSLAGFGIDIGAVMVGEPFRPGEPWWLSDHSTTVRQRPLKDALQDMACFFAVVSGGVLSRLARTQKQRAVRLHKELATLKAALAILDNARTEIYPVTEALTTAACGTLYAELADLVARLEQRLNDLSGRRSSHRNASKVHIQFWIELTHLWATITTNASRRRHKDLHKFLFACSRPLFPAATKDQTLTAFIERNFPQTSR